jgi:hypothetical protein
MCQDGIIDEILGMGFPFRRGGNHGHYNYFSEKDKFSGNPCKQPVL